MKIPFERIYAVRSPGRKLEDKPEDKPENKPENKPELEDKPEDPSPEDDTDPHDGLTRTQFNIFTEIQKNPSVTWAQLEQILNRKHSTIAQGINVLKAKGYIERVGSNKSGYWKILKDGI